MKRSSYSFGTIFHFCCPRFSGMAGLVVALWLAAGFIPFTSSGAGGANELFEAVRAGKADAVKALVEGDPKLLSARTEDGNMPLHVAALEGATAVAQVLLKSGAEVNARGLRDETPLHMAMYYGRQDTAELLLANRAAIDARNTGGDTPLHVAVRKQQPGLVALLLERGADPEVRNQDGQTPKVVASLAGFQEIVDLLTPRVGDLSDLERLTFEGAKSFSAKALRRGLRATPEFFDISHPLALREEYLQAIQRKLLVGYQHHGFPNAQISARYDAKAGRVVVKIDEGRRYACGPVTVTGLKDMPIAPLLDRLTNTNESSAIIQGSFEFVDLPKTTNGWTRSKSEQALFWAKGQEAHLSEYDLRVLTDIVKDTMRLQGFFFGKVELRTRCDEASRTAELQVQVLEEGAHGVVDRIEFVGNRKNSREALLKYLGLRPGMELTGALLPRIEERLWRAARFLSFAVKLDTPDESGRLGLQIKVVEYDDAPPVDQELSRIEDTMLKTRDWLKHLGESGEELVVTASGFPQGLPTYQMILSPQDGIAILGRPASGQSQGRSLYGFVLQPKQAFFYPESAPYKLALDELGGQLLVALNIEENPSYPDGAPFNFTMRAGYHAKPEERLTPYCLNLTLTPVACMGFAHRTNTVYRFEGDTLIQSNAVGSARFSLATGRLLEATYQTESPIRLDLRFERGALAKAARTLEQQGASLPNAYETNAPISSVLACLTDELLSSQLFDTILRTNLHVSLDGWKRVPALLRQLELRTVLSPLNRFVKPLAGSADDSYFFVPEMLASPDAVVGGFTAWIAGWLIEYSDQTFPNGSWPWTLMREAGFVLLRKGKYTDRALEAVYDSSDTGPLGHLTTASLLNRVQPPLARKFAARGLERLSLENFRKDYRLFFEGDSVVSKCCVNLATALGAFDEGSVRGLANLQSPARSEFLRECWRLMREAKGKPISEALAPALDAYWEKEMKAQVAAALEELKTDPREVFERAVALYEGKGIRQDYEQAAKLFGGLAEKGLPPAQYLLGSLYENGQGVTKDFEHALKLYEKAARQGLPAAAMALGNLYSDGISVQKDLVEAYAWYCVAAGHGDKIAETLSRSVQRRLAPDQIEAGKKKAEAILSR